MTGIAMGLGCVLACAWLFGCGSPTGQSSDEPVATRPLDVINGADDRSELFELGSEEAQRRISGSVAALMWAHRIEFDDAGSVTLRALSLTGTMNVCADERFADQPAAAFCSANLIDDNLVLTAGHCLGKDLEDAEDRCPRLGLVFDYHLTEGRELALQSGESVYFCRRVVLHEIPSEDEDSLDMGILQLDRPVGVDRMPTALAPAPPAAGQRLLAATHGAGLPLKVDAGASSTGVPENTTFFATNTDSFAGGSGGALYDERLELVAHLVRGEADWETVDDCARAARTGHGMEEHQLALTSVDELCKNGWPSERLCGIRSECGDGRCTGSENAATCADDCTEVRCGDGACDISERTDCTADCAAFGSVPASWSGDPLDYLRATQNEPPPASDSAAPRGRAGGCSVARGPRGTCEQTLSAVLLLFLRRRRLGPRPSAMDME